MPFHLEMPFTSVCLGAGLIHLLMAAVMALFARHRVQYLAMAWAMGILAAGAFYLFCFPDFILHSTPSLLSPNLLLGLLVSSFLQSFYTLGISMPGYLQWARMGKYASPAILLLIIYAGAHVVGQRPPHYNTWAQMLAAMPDIHLLLRLAVLALSIYYIVNIFRLPRILLRIPNTPSYLLGYTTALGLSACLYVWVSIRFDIRLFELWLMVFTLINLYMFFHVLETLSLSLSKPDIHSVEEAPNEEEIKKADREDFNEANLHRFERVEYWMQHHKEAWKEFTFGRDALCEATGINRHLLLQSVRSQGYNNVHEYINTYRINELQRMLRHGEAHTLRDCLDAGFGSIKTVRGAFLKVTGKNLDEYLTQKKETQA